MLVYAIDDEKAALYYLEEAIRECLPEEEIVTFDNPTKLLEAFKGRQADVVFCDIEMPVMNGIELAKELTKIREKLNIVFVTGFSEYAMDALNVYASGYVMKPCDVEDVKKALTRLRYPISKDVKVKTFGNFDVFVKGVAVKFRSPKSKELLAYLVDREGALVSRMEAAAILYEDDFSRIIQQQLSHNAKRLQEDLESSGVKGLFNIDNGYSVDLSNVDCDLVSFLKDDESVKYLGEYMEQYSWAEYRKAVLDEMAY